MKRTNGIHWTNKSVLTFAGQNDPIAAIQEAARELVLKARDSGWGGPPFSPVELARILDIAIVANNDVTDARTTFREGKPIIEYNPLQVRERVRFSLAHELAHTLFPDVAEFDRNRGGIPGASDDWQLELLCNLAAAEFVMPLGSLPPTDEIVGLEKLMKDRVRFDVSAEAYLIRIAKVATVPAAAFCASPIEDSGSRRYRIDYLVPSSTAPSLGLTGKVLDQETVISHCTAIGYTDRALENWGTSEDTLIECVGIPGYPGSLFPRVAGLIHFGAKREDRSPIEHFHGNALEPRGKGRKIICQLVNNRAVTWGGGFARQASKVFPAAEQEFREWMMKVPYRDRLGQVHFSRPTEDIWIASMVAQAGYAPTIPQKIKYEALAKCLTWVSEFAVHNGCSVHMPRIGTGQSGGDWQSVEDIINNTLISAGLDVTVYDLPPKGRQIGLFD